MLCIDCPCCGPRDHDEFRYGGDATIIRPGHDDPAMESWYRYVFIRPNPKGEHREYWQHVAGCRQWLVVERDTATHAMGRVTLAREVQP
jgi:heterotetrameric sarcosine oxidase delta subunit